MREDERTHEHGKVYNLEIGGKGDMLLCEKEKDNTVPNDTTA